jgi:hypothetical protein
VHWDSDVEAAHTPGGTRRLKDEDSLVRRLWESLPAATAAAGQASSGGAEPGLLEKASAVQWSLRKAFEGWELVVAFAAALMLVNGVALVHASGPGITFLQGARATSVNTLVKVALIRIQRCRATAEGRRGTSA